MSIRALLVGIEFNLGLLFIICLTSFSQDVKKSSPSLEKWKVANTENSQYWSVADGEITGGDGVLTIPRNTYLISDRTYSDFEFRCLFKLTGNPAGGMINSGIQYRSTVIDGKIVGYQADIGDGYWGDIYDEHRRGKLVGGDLSTLKHLLKKNDWNSYIIRCIGDKHELYINGVKTCEYIEKDTSIPSKGVFGIQLHSGGNAKIEFKHVTITPL